MFPLSGSPVFHGKNFRNLGNSSSAPTVKGPFLHIPICSQESSMTQMTPSSCACLAFTHALVEAHSRQLNKYGIKESPPSHSLLKFCYCPQMRIFSLCTRGCWADQDNSIAKAWERRENAGGWWIWGFVIHRVLLLHSATARGQTRELESCEENVMGMVKWEKVQLAKAETGIPKSPSFTLD